MRVLAILKEFPSPQRPGAGIFALRRLQAVQALGHDIAVVRIVPFAPPVGRKWQTYRSIPAIDVVEGIPVTTLRAIFPPRLIGMEYLPLQVYKRLQRVIDSFKPDVLHASYIIPSGQLAVRYGIPSVVTAHGLDAYEWPFRRPGLLAAARYAVQNATRVTAVSGALAREVEKIYPRDVDVIWNGADERFFFKQDRGEARAALQLPLDRFIIAFAGTIVRAKGVFDLIDAAARIPTYRPMVAIAGKGADLDALRDRAAQSGVEVRFLGQMQQQRLAQLYASCDVFTLPSYNEGLPNVVCEAMLCGRAVVASTAGGTPEIVQDGTSGFLTSPGDVEWLSAAYARLAADGALREKLADGARRFAEEHLTWRVSALEYDRVYREALSGTRSARTTSQTHTTHA